MRESKPIPQIAKSAIALAQADFQRVVNELGRQAIEGMGLDPSEGWAVDFDNGLAIRDVADISPPKDAAA